MITEQKRKMLDEYNEGLRLYKERQWDNAQVKFEQALIIDPQDGPSKLYISRCQEFKETPPPQDWDGVFVMKTK